MKVPGAWSDENQYPRIGYGLYRIQILHAGQNKIFGIKIYELPQSYQLYINGVKHLENGHFSVKLSEVKRTLVRPTVFFNLEGEKTEIFIEVANAGNDNPGPRKPILFGTLNSILKLQDQQHFTDMVSFGILLIMSLYHFGLYYQRKKERGSLIFGIFCFILSVRILVTEEHYLHKFYPNFPSYLEWYLDVTSFLVLTPLIIVFFKELFKREFNRNIYKGGLSFSILIVIVYSLFPNDIIFNIALTNGILCGIYFSYILSKAIAKKKTGAKIFLIGWIIFLSTAIFDVLSYNNLIRANYISHLGFLFFIFSQAFFLSVRFNKALILSEELTESLETKVKERTIELNHSLSLIHSDLQLAQKLQEALLAGNNYNHPSIKIKTIYKPVSEVGGDLFEIREIKKDRIRLFIADATGHGVQAALVTMIIKSEYENLLNLDIAPNEILNYLNQNFTSKFQSLCLLFTCFLCDVDLNEKRIYFSSAGHPSQYLLSKNQLSELNAKGKLMGFHTDEKYDLGEFPIQQQDKVLLFSDGVFEFLVDGKNSFGEKEFESLIKASTHLQIDDLIDKIEAFTTKYKNNVLDDDVTILGFEWIS